MPQPKKQVVVNGKTYYMNDYDNPDFNLDVDEVKVVKVNQSKKANFEFGTRLPVEGAPQQFPFYGIKDFINDRVNWQKSLGTINGEMGFFYFKIFFNFTSDVGLLGNIATKTDTDLTSASNTAINYFDRISTHYGTVEENVTDFATSRKYALIKFVKYLSFISSNAPWFFKSIKGIENASNEEYSLKDLTKEKTIEIECLEEAVDMRLETLFSLYKYCAYDTVGQREVLPENLRKFDMDVLTFSVPLKYFQTGFIYTDAKNTSKNGSFPYKNFYEHDAQNNDYSNLASFKLYTFKNCEFITEGLSSTSIGEYSNEQPFNLGKNSIKIKYDRLYQSLFNEWEQMFIGDYDYKNFKSPNDSTQRQRINAIINSINSNKHSITSGQISKTLLDASESLLSDAMQAVTGKDALGNLYSQSSVFNDLQADTSTIQGIGNSVRNLLDFPKKVTNSAKSAWETLKETGMQYSSGNFASQFKQGWEGHYVQKTQDYSSFQDAYAKTLASMSSTNLQRKSVAEFDAEYAKGLASLNSKTKKGKTVDEIMSDYNKGLIALNKNAKPQEKNKELKKIFSLTNGTIFTDNNSSTNVDRTDKKTLSKGMQSTYNASSGSVFKDDNPNTNVDKTAKKEHVKKTIEEYIAEYNKGLESLKKNATSPNKNENLKTKYSLKNGTAFKDDNSSTVVDRTDKKTLSKGMQSTYNASSGSVFKDDNPNTNVDRTAKKEHVKKTIEEYIADYNKGLESLKKNSVAPNKDESLKAKYSLKNGTAFVDDNPSTVVERNTIKLTPEELRARYEKMFRPFGDPQYVDTSSKRH